MIWTWLTLGEETTMARKEAYCCSGPRWSLLHGTTDMAIYFKDDQRLSVIEVMDDYYQAILMGKIEPCLLRVGS